MKDLKKRQLAGDNCTVEVYDGMMRFWVQGSYVHIPDDAELKADHHRMLVERFGDGSATVSLQTLIPWDTPDKKIEELYDAALNNIEDIIGISSESLSSAEWNAGHNDTHWDQLLTDAERSIISQAI